MSARQPDPEYEPGALLNWNSSSHWDYDGPLPCRYCGEPTQMRDSKRKPAHKTCAEDALARQQAEAADAYQIGNP
ncbi:hypothetical protein [Streptomyces lasiicapitis]|uniref:hypothetical protein n=1 Tax=Streptomyces lasiicapitis TaxID=1923961 RepID=UPI003655CAA1